MAKRTIIDEASCLRKSVKTIPTKRNPAFGPHYCPNFEESEDPANHYTTIINTVQIAYKIKFEYVYKLS